MASVSLEVFLPEVLIECPGASEPAALSAVRGAAIEFCRKSLIWTETLDPERYTAGEAQYELPEGGNRQIAAVLSVNLDGVRTLEPMSFEAVERAMPTWRTATGTPAAFVQPAPSILHFVPTPHTSGEFTATVAWAPSRDATSIDAALYRRYFETLRLGAIARLKAMSGHPFTDPATAAVYADRFVSGTTAATVERNRGYSRAVLRVTPRPFT